MVWSSKEHGRKTDAGTRSSDKAQEVIKAESDYQGFRVEKCQCKKERGK